jgi:hypothetical protein
MVSDGLQNLLFTVDFHAKDDAFVLIESFKVIDKLKDHLHGFLLGRKDKFRL